MLGWRCKYDLIVRFAEKGETARLKRDMEACSSETVSNTLIFTMLISIKRMRLSCSLRGRDRSYADHAACQNNHPYRGKPSILQCCTLWPHTPNTGTGVMPPDYWEFASHYLGKQGNYFSVIVPAGKKLFDYYRSQGFRDFFLFVRQVSFDRKRVESMPWNQTVAHYYRYFSWRI